MRARWLLPLSLLALGVAAYSLRARLARPAGELRDAVRSWARPAPRGATAERREEPWSWYWPAWYYGGTWYRYERVETRTEPAPAASEGRKIIVAPAPVVHPELAPPEPAVPAVAPPAPRRRPLRLDAERD